MKSKKVEPERKPLLGTLRQIWKHWAVRLIVGFLAAYSVLQPVFDLPNLLDAFKHLTGTTYSIEVGTERLFGSVQLLNGQGGEDSLVAWADTECELRVKISNDVKSEFRCDSITVRETLEGTSLDFSLSIENGELRRYRNAFILPGKEEVDLVLRPQQTKGNLHLLKSIIDGTQVLVIFSNRGEHTVPIYRYVVIDHEGKFVKIIENSQ